jgi:hypothetical protein
MSLRFKSRRRSMGRLLALTALVPALGLISLGATLSATQAGAIPSPWPTQHFTFTSTAGNIAVQSAIIDNFATNDQPGALVFATPNFDIGGVCGCHDSSPTNTPIGVGYIPGSPGHWVVFHEDNSAMTVGEEYNILVVPQAMPNVFRKVTSAATDSGDSSYFSNPLTNGNPNAKILVSQVYNTKNSASPGVYNNHNVGVWYNSTIKEWAVYEEDGSTMPAGLHFNILIGSANTNGGKFIVQRSAATNLDGDATEIISTLTDNDPNAFGMATHMYNPGTNPPRYDNNQAAMWYDSSSNLLTVYNWDEASMAKAESFAVLLFPGG